MNYCECYLLLNGGHFDTVVIVAVAVAQWHSGSSSGQGGSAVEESFPLFTLPLNQSAGQWALA